MNYIDYREALKIGFDDQGKYHYFQTRVLNILSGFEDGNYYPPLFSTKEYFKFCIETGLSFIENGYSAEYINKIIDLLKRETELGTFLSYYIFFVICYEDNEDKKISRDSLIVLLKDSLSAARIPFEVIDDNDELFIFPQGAKELDSALVSAPLEWLNEYPKSRETFCRALKQYSNCEYVRDVADNFRKALEEFFQEFLNNDKNLDNNRSEICKLLKENGIDKNITNMLEPL